MDPATAFSAIANPESWGPILWRAIHIIALGYPSDPSEAQRDTYEAFFTTVLPTLIPCPKCSENYRRHLRDGEVPPVSTVLGPTPSTKDGEWRPNALFAWTVELHNVVNKELGKRKKEWTVEEALEALALSCYRTKGGLDDDATRYAVPYHVVVLIALAAILISACLLVLTFF